jgi:hypothetical protein
MKSRKPFKNLCDQLVTSDQDQDGLHEKTMESLRARDVSSRAFSLPSFPSR